MVLNFVRKNYFIWSYPNSPVSFEAAPKYSALQNRVLCINTLKFVYFDVLKRKARTHYSEFIRCEHMQRHFTNNIQPITNLVHISLLFINC